MKLSIVIPAQNEEKVIESVVKDIVKEIEKENILYEIVIVNDNSQDKTGEIANKLSLENQNIKVIHRKPPKGFGRAVKEGLEHITGDAVVICMGDASDDPKDIVKYYRKLQ
ncbi:MAG: glycosyltransferase family 2 protein, partial [Endomicrobiia bacterium]